jgi:uncharacterized protein (TIGR04562 family)
MFKPRHKELLAQVDQGRLTEASLQESLDQITHPLMQESSNNPHNSEFYRAIQFTCRQLIKLQNPLYNDLKELKALAKKEEVNAELQKRIETIDLKYVQREVRFFYPYEVQIIDKASMDENERGRSAHSEYKKAQIQTAMKRVMGGLMDASR